MKHVLTAILLFVGCATFSQVKIEGVVKDSIGNPLELANVIAINQLTNKLDSYGITSEQGRYKLTLEKNTDYKIQVSYIGMKTTDVSVTTKEETITRDFTLENDNALDEVELIYEMPVTVRGDTLIYNADSFKTGTERKLEDVLKNLPGVEINADGQIEVEGKVVSKVMIEGKDFFDGDSKLATKNIPANAVDKVQVLKNYAEVGQLSGVQNNQDNIAINIKLKEGKEAFWFGTITAGAGVADDNGLYLAQPKLFYYSPKYSVNVIGDINNIGELAFTRRDYFNFAGGFNRPSQSSGTNLNLSDNGLGFLSLQNNRAKEINARFGAANFSYSPNDKLDLSGFGIYTGNKILLQENSNVIYNDPELGIPDERTESNTTQRSDLGMLKLSAKYKPNASNQLDYEILGRMSQETQEQNVFSTVVGGIAQNEDTNPFSLNQNLNYYYTLNEKNIFAFEATHLFKDEDPFYNALIANDPTNNMDIPNDPYDDTAEDLGMNQNQSRYDLSQDKRVKSNQLDAKLDYWNVLNNKSNINVTFGTILSNQKFNSNIFQTLDDGSTIDNQPTNYDPVNDTDYTFTDLYVGLHYQLKAGIFTITPGLSAHAYSSKNSQFGVSYTDNFFRILPDFNTRIQFKKSETLTFNYRMQTQFTDVNKLAEGLVLNRYNSFFSGNQELESSIAHNVSLSYFSFNMFNYTNVFARVNYTKNIDQIRTASEFQPGSVISVGTPFNSNFTDESFSASGSFQRAFGKLRATARANFSYNKFNQFINNNRSVNENYNQSYTASLRSNFKEAPNFEVSYNYGIQDNDQGSRRTKFYTNAPKLEFDALIWKTLTLKSSYEYNLLSDEAGKINSFDFWDASLAYRKDADAKWEFEMKATNLLNTKSQSQTSTGSLSVSTNDYYIQPRFVTLRVVYNL
ncbi:carboxypeptidase regulatory-like domain-containing protein [Bizionia myxarmorum]|uniref:Outer membrane beta-barrel protein n=1 Tax=Bizionia myxarmorum TaxID=291186 RepID=A0A5D0R9U2_9FLAO|nr:carboxypeptidase regulatory-like domain-containing protein [Bizionia myxarmorum]TYB78272.1 outer membrane beta-barrel protein [Bizionia myxarmorum]